MQNSIKTKNSNFFGRTLRDIVRNKEFLLLCAPATICFIIFCYLPMFGAIIAFKNYNYTLGILGSDWVGFDNFKFFFLSQDAWRITRNTIGYALANQFLSIVSSVTIALLLYEIRCKAALKVYQTIMILPRFLSWVIVGYITYILFNPELGVLNNLIEAVGGKPIDWYSTPSVWVVILPICDIWKGVGMGCIFYYAALMGIDESLYEAATIDGASRWKQITNISIPSLIPTMIILGIMALGSIFRSDFGLFYQIPRDVGALYPTTDTLDTYLYRGLRTGDVGISSAVGLFQSVVGLITVVVANAIVKKIDEDNAMF